MKKLSALYIILTVTVFALCQLPGFAHTYVHEESEYGFFTGMQSDTHHIRRRALSDWEPLRVKADFSNLSNLSQPYKDYLQYVVVPAAIEHIQNLYTVVRYTTPLTVPSNVTQCNGLAIPSELSTIGASDTDLLFIVGWVESTSSFIAKAGPCGSDATTSRPYMGSIKFNAPYLNTSDNQWQNTLSVVLHEMHHVLYFSSALFPHYIDPATLTKKNVTAEITIDGIETLVFIDPLIVKAAQDYFNCSSMMYVRLENQGGGGNKGCHWERKWFGNEFITAETATRMAISALTLTVAETSGWYKPNYTLAEKLYWGKNKGCGFLEHKCVSGDPLNASSPEFCAVSGEQGCDFESSTASDCYLIKGTVPNPTYWNYYGNNTISADPYTDNCGTQAGWSGRFCGPGGAPLKASPEYFGPNSACFKSGIHYKYLNVGDIGECYEYQCSKNADSGLYNLFVTVKSQVFNCSYLGEALETTVPGLRGSLVCPDPQMFCQIKMETCDRACAGYGTCVDGSCVCPSDRIGPDCLRYITIENDPDCACSFPAVNSYNGQCVCPNMNCSVSSIPTVSQCSACIPNCLSCTNVTVCTLCGDGYDVMNGTCVQSYNNASNGSTEAANSTQPTSENSSSSQTNSSDNVSNNTNLTLEVPISIEPMDPSNTEDNSSITNNTNDTILDTNSSQVNPEQSNSTQNGSEDVSNDIIAAPAAPYYDMSQLIACQSNQFFDKKSKSCSNCSIGCSVCTTASSCTSCAAEYLLHFSRCLRCPSECRQCEAINTSDPASLISCTECISGEYNLKQAGGVSMCVTKSEDMIFYSEIIAGAFGGAIALAAMIYYVCAIKIPQKKTFKKVSEV